MSNIFDALQRSEGERSGIDFPALSAATELLQRAERRAALKWQTSVVSKKLEATESAEVAPLTRLYSAPHVPPEIEVPVARNHASIEKHLDQFAQFQPLKVLIPAQNRLVSYTDNQSLAAEKFRFLGVRLEHLRRDRPLKKVLITSTIPQEGKSMVAGNLACTLARRAQQKILLVEGDVRRPTLSQMFGLGTTPGICECLEGERSVTASIYHLEDPGLWILPAGSTSKNPLELLQSGKLTTMIDQVATWFDWIIIDSPPVLPVADTSIWTRLADGIILVARQGITEKKQLQRGLEALESKKLIGALLNGSKHPVRSDYYYTTALP